MQKVIKLNADEIFRHSVPYDDAIGYETIRDDQPVSISQHRRAELVKDAIIEFVMHGKLDATDLKIINARSHSPVPTVREMSKIVGVPATTIHKKVNRIKSLFANV